MHSNIYDIFYSQFSLQHVSGSIAANFRLTFLLQAHSCD